MTTEWIAFYSAVTAAIIALLGTALGTYLSNKSNEKTSESNRKTQEEIAKKEQELEWLKLFQEYDFERLTYVLNPIRTVYLQNDKFLRQYSGDNENKFGNGLHEGHKDKVLKILEEHTNLVNYEMLETFYDLLDSENQRKFEKENHEKIIREMKLARGDKGVIPLEDFSFDHEREFIKLVEKEVSIIEEKYKLN